MFFKSYNFVLFANISSKGYFISQHNSLIFAIFFSHFFFFFFENFSPKHFENFYKMGGFLRILIDTHSVANLSSFQENFKLFKSVAVYHNYMP